MNDYQRIAHAIRFLTDRQHEQPSLSQLAEHLALSPSHLHRLFVRWAGITPKDFLQAATLERARTALKKGESVLSAALESGLSGPGRLHDLCVSIDAATPGEIKSGGAGLEIETAVVDSPFGPCLIGTSQRGICHLSFVENSSQDPVGSILGQWPAAKVRHAPRSIKNLSKQIFTKTTSVKSSSANLRLFVKGTPFQTKVWRALLEIPAGGVVSYGTLADAIGSAGASRAVGRAVGQNSIGFLIPCHRVILATGVIHAYRWGTERKVAMLASEFAHQI